MRYSLILSLFLIHLFCSKSFSQNYKNSLRHLNVDLNKPPETIDLTKKAMIGKWILLDPSKSEMIKVSFFDQPYYSEEERIGEENGTPYASAKAGMTALKPLGTVKKFGSFSYSVNNNLLWESKLFYIPSPGKIEVRYGGYVTYKFNIKFSNYNRLVVNDNFIFKRLE
jgi:hypothetical protein